MAIAFQTSQKGGAASGSSLTITKPTGTVSGDILVSAISVNIADSEPINGVGWTKVGQKSHSGGSPSVALFYLIAGGSEPANYQFTWTTSTSNSGVIARFDGEDTTTPEDVAKSMVEDSGTAMDWTGITTVTDGAMLIAAGSFRSTTSACGALTAPLDAGPGEIWDGATDGFESGVLAAGIQTTAGASGTKSATLTLSVTRAGLILWAIRPAAAVGGSTIPDRRRNATKPGRPTYMRW